MKKKLKIFCDIIDDSNSLCTQYSLINALRVYFYNKNNQFLNFDLKSFLQSFFDIALANKDAEALFYGSCDFSFFVKYSNNLCFKTTSKQDNISYNDLNKFKSTNFVKIFDNNSYQKYKNRFSTFVRKSLIIGNDIFGKSLKLSYKRVETMSFQDILLLIEKTINGNSPIIIAYNNNFLDMDDEIISSLNNKDVQPISKETSFFDCNHMSIIYGYEKLNGKITNLFIQDSYIRKPQGKIKIKSDYLKFFSTYYVFLKEN